MNRIQERPSGGQYTGQVKHHSVSYGHNTIVPEIAPALHVAQLTSPCSPLRCGRPECPRLRAARDGRLVAMVIPASFAILCPGHSDRPVFRFPPPPCPRSHPQNERGF